MIDFTNCPTDEPWILWDSEGNQRRINSELEFTYARMVIAENVLEGYYVTRVSDTECKEKYPINHYGVVYPNPDGLFDNNCNMSTRILYAGMNTRSNEISDYEE